MLTGQFRIERLTALDEAERIVAFLLSDVSFDDTRYTPGELAQFRELPFRALEGEIWFWYAVNEHNDIIAINCIMENEQKTGGYSWDYMAVHHDYRKLGVASALMDDMFRTLKLLQARYLVTYTCDLPAYKRIRELFVQNGFELIGRCPDYYYEGEDRLIYYLKLV
jgi:GNAT superfamily N-acetyltransferase